MIRTIVFSFPVKDTLEIFGMEIDNKLNFSSQISIVCKRINNQLDVMLRFRKIIPRDTLLKLYKAYILPHFYYCSSVWHFCGARNTDKLEVLNKRILSFILGDYSSPYSSLSLKSTLLLYVISASSISLYYYIRAWFSLIFLLI